MRKRPSSAVCAEKSWPAALPKRKFGWPDHSTSVLSRAMETVTSALAMGRLFSSSTTPARTVGDERTSGSRGWSGVDWRVFHAGAKPDLLATTVAAAPGTEKEKAPALSVVVWCLDSTSGMAIARPWLGNR